MHFFDVFLLRYTDYMSEQFSPLPNQELLSENQESLQRLTEQYGREHALQIAKMAEQDIHLFIENELRPAAAESTEWLAAELPKWEEKLEGIRAFIESEGEEKD